MPAAYTQAQRAAIAQFMSFTAAKEATAAKVGTSCLLFPLRQFCYFRNSSALSSMVRASANVHLPGVAAKGEWMERGTGS